MDIGAAFHVLYSPRTEKYHKIPAEKMEKVLEILKQDNLDGVVLEPTGVWSLPLIRFLHENGVKVYLVHTTRFRRFASSRSNVKDDKRDAYLLSEYGKLYQQGERGIILFEVNDAYIQSREMWKLWKEREALQKLINAEENRLREQLYQIHPSLGKLTRRKMLNTALDHQDEAIKGRAERITQLLFELDKLTARMESLVETLPEMKKMIDRLRTIPNLGFTTAYFIAMQIVDITRFNKRSFRAFVGVGRKKEQSGISKDKYKNAKSHKTFRKLLWMVAMRMLARKTPEWERYYVVQLARTSVPKKAIWRIVSKLVNIIYGVLRNGPYDPEKLKIDDDVYELASKMVRRNKRKRTKLKDGVKYEVRGDAHQKARRQKGAPR